MKILYLGSTVSSSTALHRASALVRLGHEVSLQDPYKALSDSLRGRWKNALHWHTGYRLLQRPVLAWLKSLVSRSDKRDVVWVDGGELFGAESVETLRMGNRPVILYNTDDPAGSRDGHRFDSLRKGVAFYDLYVGRRDVNAEVYYAMGIKKVLRLWSSYDELVHAPTQRYEPLPQRFVSDVCFIGTCIPRDNRDQFLLALKARGINLALWGDSWQRSALWRQIKSFWRGPGIHEKDYVSAISGAKVCLGLLSRGNRNLYTKRSMEIPYAGGLLCSERTAEHLQLYEEDKEAVFWSDAKECAEKCLALLADSDKRERIRLAGMERVRKNKVGNEDICRAVLECLTQGKRANL